MKLLCYPPVQKKNTTRNRDKKKQGFALVELIVTTSIILILSVQVISFSGLNEGASLNRAAQELGFAIRRAQSMALAVTALDIGGTLQIPRSVAIRVSSNTGENNEYFFFSDVNKNGQFEVSERIEPNLLLPGGVFIKEIVLVDLTTTPRAHIIFTTPEATVTLTNVAGANVGNQIRIVVQGRSGATRTVTIYASGRVSITNP